MIEREERTAQMPRRKKVTKRGCLVGSLCAKHDAGAPSVTVRYTLGQNVDILTSAGVSAIVTLLILASGGLFASIMSSLSESADRVEALIFVLESGAMTPVPYWRAEQHIQSLRKQSTFSGIAGAGFFAATTMFVAAGFTVVGDIAGTTSWLPIICAALGVLFLVTATVLMSFGCLGRASDARLALVRVAHKR